MWKFPAYKNKIHYYIVAMLVLILFSEKYNWVRDFERVDNN